MVIPGRAGGGAGLMQHERHRHRLDQRSMIIDSPRQTAEKTEYGPMHRVGDGDPLNPLDGEAFEGSSGGRRAASHSSNGSTVQKSVGGRSSFGVNCAQKG